MAINARTEKHNLNHILIDEIRASLEKQCIRILIILIKCIKIFFSSQSDQKKDRTSTTAGSSLAG